MAGKGRSLALTLYLATRRLAGRGAESGGSDGGDGGDAERLARERAGGGGRPRPDGPLIWFHTGPDRHGTAVRELAWRLASERSEISALATTTSDRRVRSQPGMISRHAPDETPAAVRRFLDHWRPDIAVFAAPDLRPVLITETDARNIPLFLVDTGETRPEPSRWPFLRGLSASLLVRFRRVLAGDPTAAEALIRLGAPADIVETSGILEEGTPALPCNEAERDALARGLAARPVWLAARIVHGECAAIAVAHDLAQRRAHRLLLILVPADPEDGPDIAADLAGRGLAVGLRSAGDEPGPGTQVYVADTAGEMGLWFRLAPIAFLGQSLAQVGGSNPYEAAALGSAILHGPHVRNYRHAYARLGAAGATRLVRSGEELGQAVEGLLAPDAAAGMAHEAWKVCSAGAEVTDRMRELVFAALDEREAT